MGKKFEVDNDETFTATMSELKRDSYWKDCFDQEDFEKLDKLEIGESVELISMMNNNPVKFKRIKITQQRNEGFI
jgi:hypothetical protein